MNFFDDKIAERLGGTSFGKNDVIYKFEMIKRAKRAAQEAFPDRPIIDMGVGEPDWAADRGVVETLSQEAGKLENRWYADNGIPEFQKAAADYMSSIYGVSDLNYEAEIVHGIGSKPILAMLPICLINPGDFLIQTVPGYPVMATYTKYLGGEVYDLPLNEENDFFPDLESIPPNVLEKAKVLYMNYPNNPTGQVATKEFFEKVVAFAKKHNIAVVNDAAYAGVVFGDYAPLSFLSIDGAKDIGIEVHSMSKSFNMTGWRLAFVAGNEKFVSAYAAVKDNSDSGQFRAIQKSAIYALNHPEITKATCEKYSRRFDMLVEALCEIGFDAKKPQGTFYCYVKAPTGANGVKLENASAASKYLIENASISTVPWDDAGPHLRFSVTFEADTIEKEKEIIDEMKNRLKKLNLTF